MFFFHLQLKDLLVRTINAFVSLFDEENHLKLPILKMELTFDDQHMQFYPPVGDLQEVILMVVKQITKTMQQVSGPVSYSPLFLSSWLCQAFVFPLVFSVSKSPLLFCSCLLYTSDAADES